jgi:transglycosylase associated protein
LTAGGGLSSDRLGLPPNNGQAATAWNRRGAFLATFVGQAIGWYRLDRGAGLIGAVVGAIIVLVIWGMIDRRRGAV